MDTELRRLLRRSPAARAVLSILRGLGPIDDGMCIPMLVTLLERKHAESTVAHAVVSLRRLGMLTWSGRWSETWRWGRSKIWRAARCGG